MSSNFRTKQKGQSNNSANPNKNICNLRVVQFLGVNHRVNYLHTILDVVRAARTSYQVRSRKSTLSKGTIGATRKQIAKKGDSRYYIIRVKSGGVFGGHAMLLDHAGKTLVDTDPRKRDKRKITHMYGVNFK